MPSQEEVVEALRGVEDPELGMDIVELGLFYEAEIEGPNVKVQYTLTSMGCPAGAMIQEDIERVVREIPGVEAVSSELTFEPPWSPDRMSDDAKFVCSAEGFLDARARRQHQLLEGSAPDEQGLPDDLEAACRGGEEAHA